MTAVAVYMIADPILNLKIAAVIGAHKEGDKVSFTPDHTPAEAPSETAEPGADEGEIRFRTKLDHSDKHVWVTLREGMVLRHKYRDKMLYAKVMRGGIEFAGIIHPHPTGAAFAAVKSMNPKATRPRGCYFWKRETAPGVWTSLYRAGK